MRRHAFTLIELLIVVAIIAIIAAIAIPNMLEAQTRSKAARAKADMKTVVTGLECYRIDNNQYPTYHYSAESVMEFHIGGKVPGWGVPDPDWNGLNPITTPVSYLTQMPKDPFVSHLAGVTTERREYLYVNWDYALARCGPNWTNVFTLAKNNYGGYRLHSRGPDGVGPDSGLPYDPTNGTTSLGDITYGPNTGFDRFIFFPTPSTPSGP